MAEHFWVGAVTHETATVKARIPTVEAATLEYDTDGAFTDPAAAVGMLVADAVWTFALEGLAPATTYHYRIQDDIDDGGGSFTTFPAPGPASYRFAAASCGGALGGDYQVGSTRTTNSPEYERIAARHPLFFVHMGDLHYRDIATNDVSDHRAGYKAVLDPARAQTLWRAVPVAFSWDDHDRGPNNNNRTYSGRAAAEQAYREYVPHYPLPADVRDGGNGEVYQTWTVGRTRHILLDTRSERSPQSDTDNSSKTMLGADQKAWLKTTLLAATEPVIFVYVGVPWIALPSSGADHWGGYATERAELAQFFHDNGLTDRLFLIHGDAHQLSYDDGTNSQYADTEEPGPRVAGCAPIDSSSSTKGGPYSQGTPVTATQQQSGLFEVADDGTTITVTLKAWSGSSSTPAFTVIETFDAPMPGGYVWSVPSTPASSPDPGGIVWGESSEPLSSTPGPTVTAKLSGAVTLPTLTVSGVLSAAGAPAGIGGSIVLPAITVAGRLAVPRPDPVIPTPVASTLEELTREGAQVICRAELYLDGQLVDAYPVEAGQVTYDATRRVVRSCDVALLGEIPAGPTDPLAPVSSVLALYRGAVDWTGEELLVPLGRYAFDETAVDRADRLIRIAGYDYSQVISDARWEQPYIIDAGTNVADAINAALAFLLPAPLWQPPNLVSTSATTPDVVWGEERENDPWADLTALAAASGLRLFFDRQGRATLATIPDPDTTEPVWDYTVGAEPTLLTTGKTLDGRPYNVVVARGEPPDDADPVQQTAEDDNPNSPSYIGRYRKPYFMTSPYITTEAQALEAARGQLRKLLGLGEQVAIASVPVPTLDVWDVVRAHDPDLKIDANYVLDSMTVPLRPGVSQMSTRRRVI